MPPSWPSRLLSGGSSSVVAPTSSSNNNNSTYNSRNKPLPRAPNEFLEPPTLNPERSAASSTRPRTQAARQHAHSRSVSHPLPKIFGRKKSSGNFHDTDVPLDDDLVPVLDEPAPKKPARVISGKKNQVDEDGKATRVCMCCDSKCKVPHELLRFRCLCCLTINDLKPAEEQTEGDKNRPHPHRATTDPAQAHPAGAPPPISLDRTRAIIDRCVLTYLESRCRQQGKASIQTPSAPPEDVFGPDQLPAVLASETMVAESTSYELVNAQTFTADQYTTTTPLPKATIRDQVDFKQFGGSRIDTPPDQHLSASNGTESAKVHPRKPVPIPTRPSRKPPPPPVQMPGRRPSHNLLPPPNGQLTPNAWTGSPRAQQSPRLTAEETEQRREYDRIKAVFRPLEDYLVASFGDLRCLNSSFSTSRPHMDARARSESEIKTPVGEHAVPDWNASPMDGLSELDAKTLLLGDIGENGTWWTGRLASKEAEKATRRKKVGEGPRRAVSSKSPNISWTEVSSWYDAVHSAGEDWKAKRAQMASETKQGDENEVRSNEADEEIEDDLADAREHAIRTLLKITENMLKRPTRPLKEPEDLRWLLIMLANPSLYPSDKPQRTRSGGNKYLSRSVSDRLAGKAPASPVKRSLGKSSGRVSSQHNGLLKRIFGLLAHSPENCHRYLIGWYSRFDEEIFIKHVDLVASFVTYRVDRRSGRPRGKSGAADNGLIPDLSGNSMNTPAQLHSAMRLGGSVKKGKSDTNEEPDWTGDWQVKAAARVMSILFAANNIWQGKRRASDAARINTHLNGGDLSPSAKAKRSGQLLHTSSFYNTLLDYLDMIEDFKEWEKRREKFTFCQYPLFISIGTKIKILEFDAQRQMALKAREAYFDQIFRSQRNDGYFHLRVRRECIVDDSLRQISEAVGAGQEDLKKGMRVHFAGEEGVDAGGPRKEWFLMLVRDIFDPNHGMFVYDDESNTCYFNPSSFETSDQYHLVGVLLGLAIYNSTILDIALPPFAFRKLLAAAPISITGTSNSNVSSLTGTKGQMTYTLQDLAEYRPSLAAGLQQLLDYDGNVQETYCRDFVASIERYGEVQSVPLIPNGENTPVTNANRHEFVDAYVRYLLDTAVSRQFEPFKRGFFTVCAGNALSLFRAEEIELLVRGSDEALDVDSLRAVAHYENWRHFQPPHQLIPNPAEQVPVIGWFWEIFGGATPDKQRKLLTFITGSDRIPAVGATSLILRIQAGGDGWGGGGVEERQRFPVARTCFNMLILWRYDYREQLEDKLWRAVNESEGFGLR
ncbi:Putative HECT domain-containing protein [Septoria linicola]|uniref:HECT-type E3 ubiquitin transferase n=1 Tax=Septoria linicola TaxID=215465 RepID=A0A9Q9AVI0_9PEZI|nr:putative HECT domain-containing protein [Septoria linicola]USW53963.1 Putative HECT domain-containing protein [Septoria linicola]